MTRNNKKKIKGESKLRNECIENLEGIKMKDKKLTHFYLIVPHFRLYSAEMTQTQHRS